MVPQYALSIILLYIRGIPNMMALVELEDVTVHIEDKCITSHGKTTLIWALALRI